MGTVTFTRTKRVAAPPMPRGDLLLESPPEIPPPPPKGGFGAVLRMLPMVAGAGAMAMMMTGGMAGGGTGRGVMGAVMGGMYGISMLGMMLSQTGRGNDDQAQELDARRRDYFRYLSQTRRRVRATADAQRAAVQWRHPDPVDLWTVVGRRRMWERRRDDEDFASARISVGTQQFGQRIIPPESRPVEDLEPLTTGALRRFRQTHNTVTSIPLAMSLSGFSTVMLVGDADAQRRLAYAMVAQLATWHSPDDLRLAGCFSRESAPAWDWLKWLPHCQHPSRADGIGPLRLLTSDAAELVQLADAVAGDPGAASSSPAHLVLVTEGVAGASSETLAGSVPSSTILVSQAREAPRRMDPGVAVLEVTTEDLVLHRRESDGKVATTHLGRPDQLPMVRAEILARQLAPFRPPEVAVEDEDSGDVAEVVFEAPKDYPTMVGVGDPLTLDVRQSWKLRPMNKRLRIPIGNGEDGRPVELDIKEAALGGMGPHGLCIGATGSGKSEFLRTLVLGLAMTHSSEQLNYVLVDFKGGATFLGLDELPHVSAVITNLEGELTLVDRMQDAIAGEMERRMEVLRSAGNFKNREDYEAARQEGADLPPMPSLFMVVDEFSELLAARPEFIELFIQIGRIGRSIGVHLLLASQRLEENKLRGLDTFLSYRIALRTFSPSESRVVIGVPDAYELPTPPGNGYLKFDTVSMVRFKAAYVSGPWQAAERDLRVEEDDADEAEPGARVSRWVPPVLEFSAEPVAVVAEPEPELPTSLAEVPASAAEPAPEPVAVDDEDDDETLLSIVVDKLRGKGWPAHQVWLPPLDVSQSLDELLGGNLTEVAGRGLTVPDTRWHARLAMPVALVDKPRQQRRDPMWLDVSGGGGNVAVVGGPQAGKTTAARAMIASMALLHTPAEVGFYCLDFGGGGLTSLRDLPHVGSVCSRLDTDRVRRTVAEMTSLLQAREVAFADLGIDSMTSYRRGRANGSIPPDRFPTDVFLVVDGWLTLRQEFEAQEPAITTLAARGLGFGIHLVATTNKWSEFRIGIRDLLQSRIELKLGDAFESEIDRKRQALVPAGRPGRGLSNDGLHMLTALPRIDGGSSPDDLQEGSRDLVARIAKAWTGPRAAEVRMLPDELPVSALPPISHDGQTRAIPYGIDELELAPVALDPLSDPHMIVFGAPECGKSTLLRTLLNGITTRYSPKEAKVMILDYRRSLLGAVEGPHLAGYAASAAAATQLMKDASAAVRSRLPGPDVTQQQLRDRSWWKGSDLFIVIDDYELVATGMQHAMQPFFDLVSQASDIGLHIILARGMGGAGRAVFSDQIVARAKDAQNPCLIMNGTRDEGVLWGDVRPSPLPPGRGTLVTRGGKVLVQTARTAWEE